MIDLTPLDVRNKRGDFKKLMRGYDPQEVDVFLEIAAERLEELVRENIVLRERSESLERQVGAQTGREQAIQEALVTAQELRADIPSGKLQKSIVILNTKDLRCTSEFPQQFLKRRPLQHYRGVSNT